MEVLVLGGVCPFAQVAAGQETPLGPGEKMFPDVVQDE